ncbi:DUF3775 domain-containing protein [Xanthobacter autotrophicus]|uniref:DUF3775 domain-containing protein n=1 Tax=Xanthobacter autotrophicus TaxID=280 RepID=UPI001E58FA3B|nr:DUF3775 domain-containing protein [Xanthobacter autotrophicus]UDQ90401.1 DUF3775 domain-containing protein [Xanthobacter autotrophicus]
MAPDATPDDDLVTLSISPETICYIIVKARSRDAKDAVTDPDPGSDGPDDGMRAVLEDHPDDPVDEELAGAITALNEDQQIDLVTLAWLGRGDQDISTWDALRAEAAASRKVSTARYLLGMPLVGDYLEEGLARLGYSCADVELGRL